MLSPLLAFVNPGRMREKVMGLLARLFSSNAIGAKPRALKVVPGK